LLGNLLHRVTEQLDYYAVKNILLPVKLVSVLNSKESDFAVLSEWGKITQHLILKETIPQFSPVM
jgi:hypothetical protein